MATARKTVSPAAEKPATVTEAELTKLVLDNEHYKQLKKELSAIENDIDKREDDIKKRIKAGAKVNSKVYNVAIENKDGARRPAWKDWYLNLATKVTGKDKKVLEVEVVDSTPVPVSEVLVISPRGQPT